jgi:hypothetical protein
LAHRPRGSELPKAPTGNRGLDEITRGGFPRGRLTLVCGGLGSGKTLLALSGYDPPSDADLAPEHGFGYHLVKPVDPDQLVRLISGGAGSLSAAPDAFQGISR